MHAHIQQSVRIIYEGIKERRKKKQEQKRETTKNYFSGCLKIQILRVSFENCMEWNIFVDLRTLSIIYSRSLSLLVVYSFMIDGENGFNNNNIISSLNNK